MNELEVKKEKFKSLLNGENSNEVSIKEAKENLLKTDPGIDISEILKAINNNEDVLKTLIIEIVSNPDLLIYYSPFLKTFLKFIIK